MMNVAFIMNGNEPPRGRSAHQIEMHYKMGDRVTFVNMDMPKQNEPVPTIWYDELEDFTPETLKLFERLTKDNGS